MTMLVSPRSVWRAVRHREVHHAALLPNSAASWTQLAPRLRERQIAVTFSAGTCGVGRVCTANSGETFLSSCLHLLSVERSSATAADRLAR